MKLKKQILKFLILSRVEHVGWEEIQGKCKCWKLETDCHQQRRMEAKIKENQGLMWAIAPERGREREEEGE